MAENCARTDASFYFASASIRDMAVSMLLWKGCCLQSNKWQKQKKNKNLRHVTYEVVQNPQSRKALIEISKIEEHI